MNENLLITLILSTTFMGAYFFWIYNEALLPIVKSAAKKLSWILGIFTLLTIGLNLRFIFSSIFSWLMPDAAKIAQTPLASLTIADIIEFVFSVLMAGFIFVPIGYFIFVPIGYFILGRLIFYFRREQLNERDRHL